MVQISSENPSLDPVPPEPVVPQLSEPISAPTIVAAEIAHIAIPPISIVGNEALIIRLTELINAAYTSAEEGIFSPAYRRTDTAEVSEYIRRGELALASRPGQELSSQSLIGCVRAVQLSADRGNFAMLVCDPAARGAGAGRELVRFAEERCRARGGTVMQCELLFTVEFTHPVKARMQAWYERMGYKVVRNGDFAVEYPHISEHLITPTEYRILEKKLV